MLSNYHLLFRQYTMLDKSKVQWIWNDKPSTNEKSAHLRCMRNVLVFNVSIYVRWAQAIEVRSIGQRHSSMKPHRQLWDWVDVTYYIHRITIHFIYTRSNVFVLYQSEWAKRLCKCVLVLVWVIVFVYIQPHWMKWDITTNEKRHHWNVNERENHCNHRREKEHLCKESPKNWKV